MIRRRPLDGAVFAALGLALLAWSARLFAVSFFSAATAAVFGLTFVAVAVLGPASGPCPLCGKVLHGLFAIPVADEERCPHCRRYFRRADGREVPADHVAPYPRYAVPIGEGETLPRLCCACAAPATRTEKLTYRGEGRLAVGSPTTVKTEIEVAVPYCAAHGDAARIWNEDLAPASPIIGGPGETDHRWVLQVRSYGFYRAVVAG